MYSQEMCNARKKSKGKIMGHYIGRFFCEQLNLTYISGHFFCEQLKFT